MTFKTLQLTVNCKLYLFVLNTFLVAINNALQWHRFNKPPVIDYSCAMRWPISKVRHGLHAFDWLLAVRLICNPVLNLSNYQTGENAVIFNDLLFSGNYKVRPLHIKYKM